MEKVLHIYTDGGSRGNPGEAGSAFVVFDTHKKIIAQKGFYLGKKTNNEAEYLAVLASLKWLKQQKNLNYDQVLWFCDSLLVVEQISDNWRVKDLKMKILKNQCQELLQELLPFNNYQFCHIPRAQNALADALVNQVLDQQLS